MIYTIVNYQFHPLGFVIFNGLFLAFFTFFFVMFAFGEIDDEEGVKLEFSIKNWEFKHIILYILIVVLLLQGLLVGASVRFLAYDKTYTHIEPLNSIKLDGEFYTCNENILIDRKAAYYCTDLPESCIVEKREKICWVFGIDKYITSYEVVFDEADYKEYFSQDIKNSDYYEIRKFISDKYGLTKYVEEETTAEENSRDAESSNEESYTKEESNTNKIDDTQLKELNDSLKDVGKNIEDLQSNIKDINKSIESITKNLNEQKNEIEVLKNKEKPKVDNGTIIIIIVGLVAFWLMILVTVVTLIKIRTHSRKELILTASDAKIREGVMLDDDK